MNHNKIIEIDNSIFLNTYFEITSTFHKKLFKNLLYNYTISDIARISNVSKWLVKNWINQERPIKLQYLIKLCKKIDITEKQLWENMLFIKTRLNSGRLFLKSRFIELDKELSELIGFVKGDGCMHKKYVELNNTDIQTVFYYTNILIKKFSLNKDQIEVTIIKSKSMQKNPKEAILYSKKNGYNHIIIRKRKNKANLPIIRCRINSLILAKIFSQIKSNLYEIILSSPKSIQKKFIVGYAAAEGSVGERRISLSQKNVKELFFLQKILLRLGYKSVKGFTKSKSKIQINIYSKKDLNKFQKEIGFGPNNKRNKKLDNLLKSYTSSIRVPKIHNYNKIFQIIEDNKGKISCPTLCQIMKKSYKETSRLLKELYESKRLRVDKHRKPYIYSLTKNNYEQNKGNF